MIKEEFSWLLRRNFLKWLAIGAFISFLLVYLFSSPLFVKPLYRSEALIFVPLTLFSQQYNQQGIGFASDVEIDGHIQILQSTRMLDSLDARFGLAGFYEIDPAKPGNRKKLYDHIQRRINIEKTRYNSVSVSVVDQNPKVAADMANTIVQLGDIIKEDVLLENRLAAYQFSKELYMQKKAEVEAFEKSLGMADTLMLSIAAPAHFGNRLEQLTYESKLWELSERRNKYETMRKSLEVSLPKSYVVSPAVVAHKPDWPPRVLLSLAATIVFIITLIFVEMIRKDVRES